MSTTTYVFMQINIINTFWLQKSALSGAMLNKNTLILLYCFMILECFLLLNSFQCCTLTNSFGAKFQMTFVICFFFFKQIIAWKEVYM